MVRSNQEFASDAKTNPLLELIAERQRNLENQRSKQRAERLQRELPSMISERVDRQMELLENQLVEEFKQLGLRAAEQSARSITNHLSERIDSLEQISALQTRSLSNLTTATRVAERKIGHVVDSVEQALSDAIPGGFELERSTVRPPRLRSGFATELVETKLRAGIDIDDLPVGKHVFCPSCTSTRVRRAYRQGMLEEVLRLFLIAPFRCKACRFKFYRF